MPLIQGKAMWAKIQKPDEYGNWCIDLVVDEAGVKQIQNDKLGHIIKQDDQGNFVLKKFKRGTVNYDGTPAAPPICVDADEQPFTALIGNGSTVLVQYHAQKYNKPKPGYKAVLDGVQVLDLVPYGTPVSEFSKVQGGYSQATEQAMEEEFKVE